MHEGEGAEAPKGSNGRVTLMHKRDPGQPQ